MQAVHNQRPTTRSFHGQKKQLLNQQAGKAPPAWKQQQQGKKGANATGSNQNESKILLSELPADVTPEEVAALFHKTVGPVDTKKTFIVYNNQGGSRGMAIVTFQKPGDAYVARSKYNGKLIDARRPIKIEIIKDEDAPTAAPASAPAKPVQPSLLERLSGVTPKGQLFAAPAMQTRKQAQLAAKAAQAAPPAPVQSREHVVGARKLRQKKGPKRVKKAPVSVAELDAQMDAYKAKAEDATMG